MRANQKFLIFEILVYCFVVNVLGCFWWDLVQLDFCLGISKGVFLLYKPIWKVLSQSFTNKQCYEFSWSIAMLKTPKAYPHKKFSFWPKKFCSNIVVRTFGLKFWGVKRIFALIGRLSFVPLFKFTILFCRLVLSNLTRSINGIWLGECANVWPAA